MKKKLISVVVWSMIAAAFIGPGTLTTASAAGAGYGYSLLWALLFATFACIVLQEASARISIENDSELPAVLRNKYSENSFKWLKILIGGSVVFGCAAYQGGNIVGSIEGIQLLVDWEKGVLVVGMVAIISILLYLGSYKNLALLLSLLVGSMGIIFLVIVLKSDHSTTEIVQGFVPSIPTGSEWLVLGLVGTTIVPYNLFLGSGISRDQEISSMRLGLIVSVLFGGIISMGIVIAGTLVSGTFSFEGLAMAMQGELGAWAIYLLAGGLFAAGFTSSVTAPLAAGFIVKGFFGHKRGDFFYRIGWMLVLASGLVIGLLDYKPIAIIISAQALNGFILPVIAVLLMIMVNDSRILRKEVQNTFIQNFAMSFVVLIASAIGLNNFISAMLKAIGTDMSKWWVIIPVSVIITAFAWWRIIKIRRSFE